jgi:hypothetical protein
MTTVVQPPARPGVQPQSADHGRWLREIAKTVNVINRGQFNCVLTVTLVENVASTTVTDARISAQTACLASPLTAHAAAEIGNGTMYFTPTNGQVVITHASNLQTDRTFNLAMIG